MKTKTFLLALLLIPYVCWVITLPIAISRRGAIDNYPLIETVSVLLFTISLIYMSTIVFWGLPYTLFSVGTLIWSKNKSSEDVYRVLFYSPASLAGIAFIGSFIAFIFTLLIPGNQNTFLNSLLTFGSFAFMSAILNLAFGYLFVGIGMVMFNIAKRAKLLIVDTVDLNNIESRTLEELVEK